MEEGINSSSDILDLSELPKGAGEKIMLIFAGKPGQAVYYMNKPVDFKKLAPKIRELINQGSGINTGKP